MCESQGRALEFLCESRDKCVNPNERGSGFCVGPGISVNLKGKSSGLCVNPEISVSPKERRSGF